LFAFQTDLLAYGVVHLSPCNTGVSGVEMLHRLVRVDDVVYEYFASKVVDGTQAYELRVPGLSGTHLAVNANGGANLSDSMRVYGRGFVVLIQTLKLAWRIFEQIMNSKACAWFC
jgi:hypothetical protein